MHKPWRGGVKADKYALDNDSSGDERTPAPAMMRGGRGGGGGVAGGINDILEHSRGHMSDREDSDEDTEDARSSDDAV